MEGQILGSRYELIEKIGGGGMAVVYKAKCRLLNRFVAVKILRPEFTNDEEFVTRFRIEAQSAASLSHPNIVSIYDVGHDENIHYIIMEYVDGITLKEYITLKRMLQWKEAVNISIQVCSAIEHAHRHHIIHRDIKPHNILLTKEGIAKVTDFGIARAASSSTITMVGSTIGSVHYFSPEQARGGFIDEKSDLYSIGITLYEMVTGRLPFNGDTPVAVALKHIQIEAEQPAIINENVPRGINAIIIKAIKKDQGQRYQTATNLIGDLYQVLKEPNGDFVTEENADVSNSPTKKIIAINDEDLISKDSMTLDGKESENKVKKKEKLSVWLAVAISVVLIGIFTFVGFQVVSTFFGANTADHFVVGNYVGRSYSEVETELKEQGITTKFNMKASDNEDKDIIMSQSIKEGTDLKPNAGEFNTIEFDVSTGPELVKIPDMSNKDYKDAKREISDMGMLVSVQDENSDTVPIGLVTRTDPEGEVEVKPGSSVTVFRSIGPEPKLTKVPILIGKTWAEAKQLLFEADLVIGKMFPEGNNYIDRIVKQNPVPEKEVNQGTAVNLYFESDTNQRKFMSEEISLNTPASGSDNFGDKVKVIVMVTPSDTNIEEIIIDEERNKDEFPIRVQVPVPYNGSSNIKVYLDNFTTNDTLSDTTGR